MQEIYHLHSDRGAQINSSGPVWNNEAWTPDQNWPILQPPEIDPELAAVRRMLAESFPRDSSITGPAAD